VYFIFYKVSFNHGLYEGHYQLALRWDAKRRSSPTVSEGSALDKGLPYGRATVRPWQRIFRTARIFASRWHG